MLVQIVKSDALHFPGITLQRFLNIGFTERRMGELNKNLGHIVKLNSKLLRDQNYGTGGFSRF